MNLFSGKIISFLISQAIIWLPLAFGHGLRRRGWVSGRVAKPIHALNLTLVVPMVYGLGIWRLDRSAPHWYWVPVVMALLLTVSTAAGTWLSHRFIPDRASAGTFALMLPLSNMGHTLAGFVTLLLLSDLGYSFNSLLMCPMVLFNFLVWLPQARHWGHGAGQSFARSFGQTMVSAQSLILVGLVVGMALNVRRTPMSDFWVAVLKVMVYAGTISTMFAMGSRLRLRRMLGYQRLLGWVYPVKFLIHPLIVIGLCLAFGLHGVPAGALFIAACAPAGVNVVVFSTLFDLDVDLANAGFLWSTLIFMLVVLPLIILCLQLPIFRY